MKTKQILLTGFTLLEMMIVIAVMGILIALALRGVGGIVNKAKESSVKSVAHQLQIAIETYRLDQGMYPSGALQVETLIDQLHQYGGLPTTPKNPFTGLAYQNNDPSGKILYTSPDAGATYTLSAYGTLNASRIFEVIGE